MRSAQALSHAELVSIVNHTLVAVCGNEEGTMLDPDQDFHEDTISNVCAALQEYDLLPDVPTPWPPPGV